MNSEEEVKPEASQGEAKVQTEDVSTSPEVTNDEQASPESGAKVEGPEVSPAAPPTELMVGHIGHHKPPKKLLVVLVLVLLAAIGAGVWGYLQRNKTTPTPKSSTAQQKTTATQAPKATGPQISEEDKALLAKFITPTTGETWYAAPVALADQKLLPAQTAEDITNAVPKPEYKEVGTRGDNKILLVKTPAAGIGDNYYLFERAENGTTRVILHPDANANYQYDPTAAEFTKGVILDSTTHYDSLTLPGMIDLGNGDVVKKTESTALSDIFFSAEGTTTVKQLGSSRIVKTARTDKTTHLSSYGYAVQYPFSTVVGLAYEPLETNLKDYKWQNGVATSDTIHAIARGCGGLSAAVTIADDAKDADFVVSGTSPSGLKVYDAKDSNYVLLNKAYDEFHTAYDYARTSTTASADEKRLANMMKEEFLKQHGVVFYKDVHGQWLIFAREQLSVGGGCAKPVVYLYPTKAEHVNVRLGASVKISDPLYNVTTGWNVWATPGGALSTGGKQYGSLFWEGIGQGQYPSITEGTIVPHAQAATTIRSQLQQQGLTTNEANEFMAYWTGKIPNKPYVRLTWFGNQQLNDLAPLHVTPAPDTVIRVFLDMDGLDQPISLPVQQLRATPRHGFTVVEWGGLASGKLF